MYVIIACYIISIIAWFVGVAMSYWKENVTLMQISVIAILFFGSLLKVMSR